MKIKYPIGGYAPGNYTQKCTNCKGKFIGDKLATQCMSCAINSINESNKKALIELAKLKEALREIKTNSDIIDKIIWDEK